MQSHWVDFEVLQGSVLFVLTLYSILGTLHPRYKNSVYKQAPSLDCSEECWGTGKINDALRYKEVFQLDNEPTTLDQAALQEVRLISFLKNKIYAVARSQ